MNKLERLAAVGLTDSPEDVAKFYQMFPTPESFDAYMSGKQQYAMGGITDGKAFPQQATAKEFFNNTFAPNTPRGFYKSGGALPGGANEMPCFECGGYMEMGGEEGGEVSAFNYGQFPAIMEEGRSEEHTSELQSH